MPKILIFTFYLIPFSGLCHSVDLNKLAESKHWLRMLHYEPGTIIQKQSSMDGAGFFFAKTGAYEPLAELKASIAAMDDDSLKVGKFKLHPQCAFPARYRFLKKYAKLKMKDRPCPKVDEYLQMFNDPHSVSVIFSSAYPNNPGSMFGHTFLKINSKANNPLRDYGISYAAYIGPEVGNFNYMWSGLTGGFFGFWSVLPYHEKVKEYNLSENRDLWEYELNLTKEETNLLLLHLWEFETNSFKYYYFFDENCSYEILKLIEAIKPEWNITDHTLYMIPGESIKNLFNDQQMVRAVKFRPSVQKQVKRSVERLHSKEKKMFMELLDTGNTKNLSRSVLEAGLLYSNFIKIKKNGKLTDKEKKLETELLVARARLGKQEIIHPIVDLETRPDLGHDSYSLTLGAFQRRGDNHNVSSTLKIKSAYHDLLNNDLGFKRYSHIDFPAIQLRYDATMDSYFVDEITALNITSLPPRSFLSDSMSWKIESGLYSPEDYGCFDCRHVFMKAGGGATWSLLDQQNIFYTLLTARADFYDELQNGYRFGPGIDLGVLLNLIPNNKWHFSAEFFNDVDQSERASILARYQIETSFHLARNLELRIGWRGLYPREKPKLINQRYQSEIIFFFR